MSRSRWVPLPIVQEWPSQEQSRLAGLLFSQEKYVLDRSSRDVRLDGNTLTVSGERKFEQGEKRENFRRVERQYGSFSRSFELPASADREKVHANFENGVLRIEIPKRPESRGRQIQIGSGAESTGKKTLKAA
jgi:hypothetical protein